MNEDTKPSKFNSGRILPLGGSLGLVTDVLFVDFTSCTIRQHHELLIP